MENINPAFEILWFIGIGVSVQCLLIQFFLYAVLPSSRKLDQKVLTQLSIARLVNVVVEWYLTYGTTDDPKVRDAVFALYLQTDAAIVCWMFVFTKNLYDKVILVFNFKKISFVLVSLSIWVLTLPVGLLCPLFLSMDNQRNVTDVDDNEEFSAFDTFYYVYGIVKFIILFINLIFFGRIFWVAISRRLDGLKGFFKTCCVSFIIVCITSLQVLLTDLTTFFAEESMFKLGIGFGILNSFQVLLITSIFVILSRSTNESLCKTIVLKLKALLV